MDVERNVKQASTDVDAFLSTGGYVHDYDTAVAKVDAPIATRSDFLAHFGKWENGKVGARCLGPLQASTDPASLSQVLLGCAWSWFALDVAFYGLGLNSSIILSVGAHPTFSLGSR